MQSQVELIAYAERFGGSLDGLHRLLDDRFPGLFGGVHVLPFYRPFDGADAGFDPEDHTEVDPRLGTWDDVRSLAEDYWVTADVIVNHISSSSPQFRDWLANGSSSPFDGMFLTFRHVFPEGATEDELMRLYRPRPGLPFTPYATADGHQLLWTTFTPRQIDLDVNHPTTRDYLVHVVDSLHRAGVRRVRLDAVGYAIKTPGLSSFMTPESFRFIEDLADWCRACGLDVLVEVHSHHELQVEIASRVDRVYDFALPPLILHALTAGDPAPLLRWMDVRPTNAITVLDTHDGIGIIDVGGQPGDPSRVGLLSGDEIVALAEAIHSNSGGTSRTATGWSASNVDLYQVNCTYYDALGGDDDRYLLARALQFWAPGVPQVYYVGLLAGSNDTDLLARTNVGRDVNRHHYTPEEIDAALQRRVVRALGGLIRFRNTHPAFDGEFAIEAHGSRVTASWSGDGHLARLDGDVATGEATVTWSDDGTHRQAPLHALA